MGKSYAFLVLAICLSSTITSCAKTEKNNRTEEVFFARDNTNNGKQDGSERDFTDDFIYSMENMVAASVPASRTSVVSGSSLNSAFVEAYGGNSVNTLSYEGASSGREIRAYTMRQEEKSHRSSSIYRSLLGIKAMVMGK